MTDTAPRLSAAAAGFERLSPQEREQVLDAVSYVQRAFAQLPGANESFERSGPAIADFSIALAERIGERRFEALLLDANLDEETRRSFSSKAEESGGIVPLLKHRLEKEATFDAGEIVCCVSGAVLAVGGGALAVDGVLTADVPLVLFGAGLAGVGIGAMIVCC